MATTRAVHPALETGTNQGGADRDAMAKARSHLAITAEKSPSSAGQVLNLRAIEQA